MTDAEWLVVGERVARGETYVSALAGTKKTRHEAKRNLKRLGVWVDKSRRRITEADRDEALRLQDAGKGRAEIAQALGRSKDAVSKMLQRTVRASTVRVGTDWLRKPLIKRESANV